MEMWMKRTEKDSTFRSLCCYLVLSCVLGKRVGDKRIVSFFLFLIIYRAAYSQ